MASKFVYKVFLVVPANQATTANSLAMKLDPNGGINSFIVGLNPNASKSSSASHYWCAPVLTAGCWNIIKSYFDAALVTNSFYYQVDPTSSMILLDTNDVASSGRIGSNWSINATLSALNLNIMTS